MTEDETLRKAEKTASGYFMIVFEQYQCWQGFFIDNVYVEAAKSPLVSTTPEQIIDSMLRLFLSGGVTGDMGSRRIEHNEQHIGVLGALFRENLSCDYFLVEGTINPDRSLMAKVQSFTGSSLREGRDAIMNTPLIQRLRAAAIN
jgi:hypothetical protein